LDNLSPGLFLDRDGVINQDFGYVHTIEKFKFLPGIFDFCKIAQNARMKIVIVTNQSGIGRGYFSQNQFDKLMNWVVVEFKKEGITISGVLCAPENPQIGDQAPVKILRRKPSPAMFLEASTKYSINLESSLMIGDMDSDMIAAANAGVKGRILLGDSQGRSAQTTTAVDLKEAAVKLQDFISANIER
jgi:D-glycero-D-manno-heptose 1,7-bisphosphate phosphatase